MTMKKGIHGLNVKSHVMATRDEEGSILPLVALMIVVILGMASLVLDIGTMYINKQRLQGAADFGALAGADQLLQGAGPATQTALNQSAQNNADGSFSVSVDTSGDAVTVSGVETDALWFARIFGQATGQVHAYATAQIGTLTSATGIVPIGVASQTLVYGQEVNLSDGAGDGQSGNYGFLDFSGQGANGLETDIENGFDFPLSVGEQVSTKPGIMSGPVSTAVNYRLAQAQSCADCSSFQTAQSDCPRVMYLPIVNTLDVSGKKDVTILGFAAFYLEGLVGDGGHQQIVGRFIQMVRPGTIGIGQNYGTYGVKLTQ